MTRRGAGMLALVASVAVAAPAGEWVALFDGGNLNAWRPYRKTDDAPITWAVEDGALAWRKGGGNLVTRETYRDFELELEWKTSPGGNSGIMFGVDETSDKPWHTGPEIQILDDGAHRDGRSGLTRAGALYYLYPPAKHMAKPVGEWNALRLRVQGGKVQSWLNGELVVDAQIGSADWDERVAKSKFARFTNFARVTNGHILLQDHNDPVWFRNIRIRRL